jgi:hypothetical protein
MVQFGHHGVGSARDPSLRLKNGSARDDADEGFGGQNFETGHYTSLSQACSRKAFTLKPRPGGPSAKVTLISGVSTLESRQHPPHRNDVENDVGGPRARQIEER